MRKYALILLLLASCQSGEQPEKKTSSPKGKGPVKLFSGVPDLPQSDTQITSAGIGKLLLGDPLAKVDQLYDSVVDLTLWKEGGEWRAKKVIFQNGEYLLAESVHSVNQITGLYTNLSSLRTKNGVSAGMSLDSVSLKDSIVAEPAYNAFWMYRTGIFLKLNQKKEKNKIKSSKSDEAGKGSTIEELFILCGDC